MQQLQVEIPLLQAAGPSVQQSRKEASVAGVVKEVVRVEVCACVRERESAPVEVCVCLKEREIVFICVCV